MKNEVKRILFQHIGWMFATEIALFVVLVFVFFVNPDIVFQSSEVKLTNAIFWNMLMNGLLFAVLLAAKKDEYLKDNARKICNRDYIVTRTMPVFFGTLPLLFIADRSTWFYQGVSVLCCLSAATIIVLGFSVRKHYKSLT